VIRETQLALTNGLKGNLTDRFRTRNSPLVFICHNGVNSTWHRCAVLELT